MLRGMVTTNLTGFIVAVQWRRDSWREYALLASDEIHALVIVAESLNLRDEPTELRKTLLPHQILTFNLRKGEVLKLPMPDRAGTLFAK
jgi:hypothetical protein